MLLKTPALTIKEYIMNIVVKMSLDKETKNTVRYNADAQGAAIQALYIMKDKLKNKPNHILVTVSEPKSKKETSTESE